MIRKLVSYISGLLLLMAVPGLAQQETDPPPSDTEAADDASTRDELLSDAELQTLVAPVALYPDTLLIQILVAATQPLEIIKSERFLVDNEGADPEALKSDIEAQEWDESVAVLATAFPDVIGDMAEHIDWTETVGDAMLAQDDDVMDAVQVMRAQAIDSGALLSGEAQTVETDENDDVIIQPTDPNVVYVPQYQPDQVYAQPVADGASAVSDALVAGAIGFGTFAVMDAIFDDDDDDWDNYWGCRNCGGWDGGPIIREPNIDLDVDGNVNIGNRGTAGQIKDKVSAGDLEGKINSGDIKDNLRNRDGGWKPDAAKKNDARNKIAARRDDSGKTKLPIKKGGSKADELRSNLAGKTNARDISKPDIDLKNIKRPEKKVSAGDRAAALKKTADKPKLKKPAAIKRPSSPKKAITKNNISAKKPSALKKTGSGSKIQAASKRGKAVKRKGGTKRKLKR